MVHINTGLLFNYEKGTHLRQSNEVERDYMADADFTKCVSWKSYLISLHSSFPHICNNGDDNKIYLIELV